MKLKKIVSLLSVLGIALVCAFPAAVVSGEASIDTRYHHAFAEPFLAEYAPAAHGSHSYQELLDDFHILSDNMIRLGIQSVAIREAENVVLVIPEPGGHASLQKEIDTLVDSNVVKIDYSIENSPSEQRMEHVFT